MKMEPGWWRKLGGWIMWISFCLGYKGKNMKTCVVFPQLLEHFNSWLAHGNAELLSFSSALKVSKRLHSSGEWAFKMTPGKRNQTCRKDGWHPSELGPQKTSLFNPEGLMGVSGIISDNLVLCFSRLCSVLWDYCVAFPQDPAAHWGINTYFYQPWADDDLSIFIHAFFSHRKYE